MLPSTMNNGKDMEQIQGYIENIIFSNEDNGFTVAKIKEENKYKHTCIVGHFSEVKPGESIKCEGKWITHSSYGMQFEVENYHIYAPSDILGIQKYLESGLVKGIGAVYANKIVEKFKENTLEIIDLSPHRLLEIPGIGPKRIEQIIQCWEAQKKIREVIIFLKSYNISPSFAQKIFKTYSDKSIEIIKENPYQLAKDITGIGFKIADTIAIKMGFEFHSNKRIKSGIEFVLWELTNSGHTCFPEDDFLKESAKTLDVSQEEVLSTLNNMIEEKLIIKAFLPKQNKSFIWLKALYSYEMAIALELKRLSLCDSNIRSIATDRAISWAEEQMNMSFAPQQKLAIEKGVSEKVHIITGGPGTGKSTITNAIIKISEKLTNKIILAAPTGRAAKRLSQITKKRASTIHSLLEYDFTTGGFKKGKDNLLKCELLIIDEASMIDTFLMHSLLKSIPDEARVVFIGDIDQLPSVGPGYILKDIIESETINMTRLNEIYRQAEGSKIIINAHKINAGEMPEFTDNKPWQDFHFYEIKEIEEIEKIILDLITKKLPETKKLDPFKDIQVLSPMRKGKIGADSLNITLQHALNPSSRPLIKGGKRFHLGDKVMQIRNNYTKNVYNGDIGKITLIDPIEQCVLINFDNNVIDYDFSELDEISLAYAVSVHKYQGSECPCVVIPIHTAHFKLLYRNLLYTGITRGKKLVILVGTKKAIAIAVKNNEVQKRHTGLEECLRNSYISNSTQVVLPGLKF